MAGYNDRVWYGTVVRGGAVRYCAVEYGTVAVR